VPEVVLIEESDPGRGRGRKPTVAGHGHTESLLLEELHRDRVGGGNLRSVVEGSVINHDDVEIRDRLSR